MIIHRDIQVNGKIIFGNNGSNNAVFDGNYFDIKAKKKIILRSNSKGQVGDVGVAVEGGAIQVLREELEKDGKGKDTTLVEEGGGMRMEFRSHSLFSITSKSKICNV